MDFSSPSRALLSLDRRSPALPEEILAISKPMFTAITKLSSSSTSDEDRKTLTQQYLDGIQSLLTQKDLRWEALAVGVFCGTSLLEGQTKTDNTVYTEGPRVPSSTPSHPAVANIPTTASSATTTPIDLTVEETMQLATMLHDTSLLHLEHSEPRIRTLVAKAVGAHAAFLVSRSNEPDEHYGLLQQQCAALHQRITNSIEEHMQQGREVPAAETEDKNAVLDDTTGWRALETNWQCLACFVQPLGGLYFSLFPLMEGKLLEQCQASAIEHINRHVRAAADLVLEQWVRAAASLPSDSDVHPAICKTVTAVLKDGLADNWSQVRMAASVLCRVFFLEYLSKHPASNEKAMYAVLIPRMCLNRFYLAQGVKLYSHDTWRQVFKENGLEMVAQNVGPVCRYYVKMCDANNHVVREAGCQAIAELAVKLSARYPEELQPFVSMLLQTLLMCFHDESWPVRDEACVACGIFCKAYPEECRVELKTLWERWTEQLTDQIWSVREDAAAALGDAMQAYGKEMMDKCIALVKKLLPSAKDQPAMTMEEYKQKQNDIESHTDAQLYSCGSLAPKLGKKSGAGRIGCSSCGITRPKAPWEATDGSVYLLRELVILGCGEDNTNPDLALSDEVLLPLLTELADVCRVQHFPQSDDLRATLWRQLPSMARALGKQRFKRLYLDVFMDLLLSNMERSTASALSKHAAGQCAEELSQFIGPSIFRGRLDDYQQRTFDRAMQERQQQMPKGPIDGAVFSPFGPPGMLDHVIVNNPQSAR
jgi:hypothetical protein